MVEKVLVVVAHPDDEAFGPGGTIALWAKAGAKITLICVTDGGLKERETELKESAKILGISEVILLGYPDGCLCHNVYNEIAGKIQVVVDRVKPSLLMTFEPRGVSGHIDHMAVSMITSYVFRENKMVKELWQFAELEWEFERPWRNRYFIYLTRTLSPGTSVQRRKYSRGILSPWHSGIGMAPTPSIDYCTT